MMNILKIKKPSVILQETNMQFYDCKTGDPKNTTRCTAAYPYLQGDMCYQRIECSHSGGKGTECKKAMYNEENFYQCDNNKIAAKKEIAPFDGKTQKVKLKVYDSYGDGLNGTQVMWTAHPDGIDYDYMKNIDPNPNIDNHIRMGYGGIFPSTIKESIATTGNGPFEALVDAPCDIPSQWSCSFQTEGYEPFYSEEVSFEVVGYGTIQCEPGGGPLAEITIKCSNCPVDDGIKDAGCTDEYKYRTKHANHDGAYCYNTKACAHSNDCWQESGGSDACKEIAWVDSADACECKQTCGTQDLWKGDNWCYTKGTCNADDNADGHGYWKFCDV